MIKICKNKVEGYLGERMKKIKWFILVLFYIAVFVVLYVHDGKKYIEKVSVQYLHQDLAVTNITDSKTVGQTFIAKDDNISSVSLMFATYDRKNSGSVVFHLKESLESKDDIVTKSIAIADLHDNAMYNISFPEVKIQKGKTYYFYIESPGATEHNSITVWYDALKSPKGTEFYVDNKWQYGSLTYVIYHKEHKGLHIL
jgi:hypothetical protein